MTNNMKLAAIIAGITIILGLVLETIHIIEYPELTSAQWLRANWEYFLLAILGTSAVIYLMSKDLKLVKSKN